MTQGSVLAAALLQLSLVYPNSLLVTITTRHPHGRSLAVGTLAKSEVLPGGLLHLLRGLRRQQGAAEGSRDAGGSEAWTTSDEHKGINAFMSLSRPPPPPFIYSRSTSAE